MQCPTRRRAGRLARQNLPRTSHEELEQREFLGREIELGLASPRALSCRIEPEIPDLRDHQAFAWSAPHQRPDPCQRLATRRA